MPCEHCGEFDHVKWDCPLAANELRKDHLLGGIVVLLLLPFYIAGILMGSIYGALSQGFLKAHALWSNSLLWMKRKPDPPESA